MIQKRLISHLKASYQMNFLNNNTFNRLRAHTHTHKYTTEKRPKRTKTVCTDFVFI